jgi:hypothetical protein
MKFGKKSIPKDNVIFDCIHVNFSFFVPTGTGSVERKVEASTAPLCSLRL